MCSPPVHTYRVDRPFSASDAVDKYPLEHVNLRSGSGKKGYGQQSVGELRYHRNGWPQHVVRYDPRWKDGVPHTDFQGCL